MLLIRKLGIARTLTRWPSRIAEHTSTPIVLLLSRLNSFFVNRVNKLDLPTPESPINTTAKSQQQGGG